MYERRHWSSIVARSSDRGRPLRLARRSPPRAVCARSHSPARIAALPNSVSSALRLGSPRSSSARARSNIIDRSGQVLAAERAAARDASTLPASARARLRGLVGRAELRAVAVRLLEVVADDLVVLAKARPRLRLEPAREPLVELRPHRLRHARVRSSRISEWRKRNASSPGISARAGFTRPLRTSDRAARHARLVGGEESATTARARTPSRRRTARSSTRRSAGSRLSIRAASSAWIDAGSSIASVGAASRDHRRELLGEQRVALGGRGDPLRAPRRRRRARCDELGGLVVRRAARARAVRRASPDASRAARARAMQSSDDRCPVANAARYSTRSSIVGSAQWRSSRHDKRAALAPSPRAAGGPPRRPRRSAPAASAAPIASSQALERRPRARRQSRRARPRRRRSRRGRATSSTSGQYVMPCPYGRHRPDHDARASSSSEPAPARAATFRCPPADDGRRAGTALGERVLERRPERRRARSCGRRGARRAAARAGGRRRRPLRAGYAATASLLPFAREPLARADLDGVLDEADTSPSPIRIAPGSAACSSRLARFTASPVTNVSPGPGRRRRPRPC